MHRPPLLLVQIGVPAPESFTVRLPATSTSPLVSTAMAPPLDEFVQSGVPADEYLIVPADPPVTNAFPQLSTAMAVPPGVFVQSGTPPWAEARGATATNAEKITEGRDAEGGVGFFFLFFFFFFFFFH